MRSPARVRTTAGPVADAVGAAHVGAEGRLAVGARRHQTVRAASNTGRANFLFFGTTSTYCWPRVQSRAGARQRPACLRRLRARPRRHPPRDRPVRPHPGRGPHLRPDPLREQRARPVRPAAIAPAIRCLARRYRQHQGQHRGRARLAEQPGRHRHRPAGLDAVVHHEHRAVQASTASRASPGNSRVRHSEPSRCALLCRRGPGPLRPSRSA